MPPPTRPALSPEVVRARYSPTGSCGREGAVVVKLRDRPEALRLSVEP